MNPSIDEQIEAVEQARHAYYGEYAPTPFEELDAAIETLKWVKRHAPLIKTILGEFEGSTVKPREEE